ncbi:Heparinase II/III-like protein [Sanguibacter gelidistatuariae]|uniref:Heparinase II/III-like protein n=1 Tax=Sanguibacter gelidistatuariae TaxID=1814289 RepID=A0A1G6WCH9_9MICO|nr:heparinase II/III family protein [Sanguibacter gelidistatuariae]SDD63504.1 Heparinase II/III-like protein [Sanguibacter gelidistatuariae]
MTVITQARGGWWHDYVCPTHGTELDEPVDGVFPCRYGCRLSDERLAGAWTVLDHQRRARRARLLARQGAVSGSSSDKAQAVGIVCEFADLYQTLATSWSETSEPWMLRGKLFSQALTEAIWATQLADVIVVLADDEKSREALTPEVPAMLDGLLATVEAARHVLVVEQGNPQSNYTAWLDAAGHMLSRARSTLGSTPGLPATATRWVERSWEHAKLAVGADGWEWEGSTYYHLFVLRAYLLTHRGIRPDTIEAGTLDRLASMVRALAEIAAPDGSLPALHDGPYDRREVHLEVLEICMLARQMWATTGLGTVEAHARAQLATSAGGYDGLEDLLDGWFDGPPLMAITTSRASRTFDQVGYAVLRDCDDTWQAVLDAGPHGGSHGHLDKLGLYLYGAAAPWQPAPGVPPYASRLRHGYYARTVAHPTVRVDDADQTESTGALTTWDTDGTTTRVMARADSSYPGVRLSREVVMTADYLLDVVTAEAETERTMTLGLRPAVPLEITAQGEGWVSRWTGSARTDLHGLHAASVPSAIELTPGRGPSNDPARLLALGEWTARAACVSWVSVYHQGSQPRLRHLELVAETTGLAAVRVHHLDGTTTEHEVSR